MLGIISPLSCLVSLHSMNILVYATSGVRFNAGTLFMFQRTIQHYLAAFSANDAEGRKSVTCALELSVQSSIQFHTKLGPTQSYTEPATPLPAILFLSG
jgi:hypothetical protein